MTSFKDRATKWLEKGGVDPEKTIGENIWAFAAHLDSLEKLPENPEDVPHAARAAFTCLHEFKKFDELDLKSIDVYCFKCGSTVIGNRIFPPVAYAESPSPKPQDKPTGGECCEKCYTNVSDKGWPIATMEDACLNLSCKCHTKLQEQGERVEIEELGPMGSIKGPNELPSIEEQLWWKLNELIRAWNNRK